MLTKTHPMSETLLFMATSAELGASLPQPQFLNVICTKLCEYCTVKGACGGGGHIVDAERRIERLNDGQRCIEQTAVYSTGVKFAGDDDACPAGKDEGENALKRAG
jgi:hypothetical protein